MVLVEHRLPVRQRPALDCRVDFITGEKSLSEMDGCKGTKTAIGFRSFGFLTPRIFIQFGPVRTKASKTARRIFLYARRGSER